MSVGITSWIAYSLASLFLAASGATSPGTSSLFPAAQLARIQQGLRDIYGMNYQDAARNFEGMIQESPDDPAGYTYLAMTYWIEDLSRKQELSIDRFAASDFFAEEPQNRPKADAAMEARFRQMSQQAIEKARARLKKNPGDRAARFLRGLAYQNLASFEACQQRWWAAVRYGSMTFEDHKALLRSDPSFHDAEVSVGVGHYVAGRLPWALKWIAVLLGHTGSTERGKRELETVVREGVLAADDARVVLILIYTREKRYERAAELLLELHEKYPHNYLAYLDMGWMQLLMKRADRAVAIYEDILRKREAGEAKYADLERSLLYNRLGVAFRSKGDLETSARWFGKALEENGVSMRAAIIARLELGKTLDLMGRRGEALKNYQQVASSADFAGSRSEAEKLLQHPFRG